METTTLPPELPVGPDLKGDLHLRFELGGQRNVPGTIYAFPAAGVVEVVDLSVSQVTALPNTSPALVGTFNLRGEIIWILDTEYVLHNTFFNTNTTAFPVVVIQDGEHLLGLAVRSIQGMVWLKPEQIETVEIVHSPALKPFVRGQVEGHLLILDSTTILRSQCWAEKPAIHPPA